MNLQQLLSKYTQEEFIQKVDEQLDRLKKENPDFVYTNVPDVGCDYFGPAVLDGKQVGPDCSGCIFGQAMQALGLTELSQDEKSLYIQDFILFAPNRWTEIQKKQDNGVKWGDL